MKENEIWGITTYFNPAGYHTKKENFLKFRKCSKKQGLKLLCVEMAVQGSDYELADGDADIIVRTVSKDVLWQKERMLNVGLKSLPDECTKIIWVDCDVVFDNDNWVEETSDLLDQYCIVQPFQQSYKLRQGEAIPEDIMSMPEGKNNGERLESFVSVLVSHGFSDDKYLGHKGFCWAGRRKIFDKIGFYDFAILGEGDSIMSHAFIGKDVPGYTELLPEKCRKHQQEWRDRAYELVKGSMYFTKGGIYHLFHGEMKNRIYREKIGQYMLADFDPTCDIKVDEETQMWLWNSDKPEFHQFLSNYFYSRKEDGASGKMVGVERTKKMSRCKKCGLTMLYPNAVDKNSNDGECSFCKKFEKKKFLGEEKLLERIGDAEKIGVTVSGGKDSIYVWNWLVKKFGPERIIALNHNKVRAVNTIASKNIQRAKNILNSEVIIVNDFEFYPRFVKNISAYIDNPNPAILRAVVCAGCRNGISNRMFEEALRYDIHTVVNGSSYLELAPFKSQIMKEYGDGDELRGLLRGLSENEQYLNENNLQTIIKDHFNCHLTNLSNQKNGFGIDYVDFFHYFENRPSEIKKTVIEELAWEHPENVDWHFDCIVEAFKQFFYYLEYGYSEMDYKTSEMVRYGLLNREEAIAIIEKENDHIMKSGDDLKQKLIKYGCSKETVRKFEKFCKEKVVEIGA